MAYDLSDYVDVAERVQKFHEKYPEGSLQSEWTVVELDGKPTIVVKAFAYRTPDDAKPGIGHATEPLPGLTKFTKNSELMVGETSAWGRALAALGFEVKRGIASREEVMNRSEADGGGGSDIGVSAHHNAAPVGFASDSVEAQAQAEQETRRGFASAKQEAFFDRLLKKGGLDSNQVEAVNRYAETLPTARVSKAMDGLNDDDGRTVDATLEALVVEADKYAKAQSDVPYDETA